MTMTTLDMDALAARIQEKCKTVGLVSVYHDENTGKDYEHFHTTEAHKARWDKIHTKRGTFVKG